MRAAALSRTTAGIGVPENALIKSSTTWPNFAAQKRQSNVKCCVSSIRDQFLERVRHVFLRAERLLTLSNFVSILVP